MKATENQNIEWKESWQDDYLKWVCDFANAQGGSLEIGRNDIRYNDCRLPSNIVPENLLDGIGSRPYNPLIAGAFFHSGQIEAWGRGIEKMKNGCTADKLPEPEFKILPTMFSISFGIHSEDTATVEENSTTVKELLEIEEENEAENQKLILAGIAENPRVTIDELTQIVGIGASKINK